MIDDESTLFPAWIVGVGLMLTLTTMASAGQAAVLRTSTPLPCPTVYTNPPDVGVGRCDFSVGVANAVLWGNHPTASGSAAFSSANATALAEDVRVTWTFNETEVDGNVTAFHVQRGLGPTLPHTMEHVATLDPNADAYLDEGATTSGDAWYVVSAEMDDGSTEESHPFRIDDIRAGP